MIIIYTYIFPAAERFQGSLASVTLTGVTINHETISHDCRPTLTTRKADHGAYFFQAPCYWHVLSCLFAWDRTSETRMWRCIIGMTGCSYMSAIGYSYSNHHDICAYIHKPMFTLRMGSHVWDAHRLRSVNNNDNNNDND